MKNLESLFVYSITNLLERFGFYALMSVLVLSLVDKVGLSREEAGNYYSVFFVSIYFSILIMGLVGDFLNRRNVIKFGMIFMAVGYFLYSIIPGSSGALLIIPFIFITLGVGAFKTNLMVQVGDLYKSSIKNGAIGFLIFNSLLNIGALIAPIAAVFLKNEYGTDSVVLLSSLLIVSALALYYFFPVSTENEFKHSNKKPLKNERIKHFEVSSDEKNKSNNTKYGTDKLLLIIFFIILIPLFWMAFHQNGMVYTLFVKDFINSANNPFSNIQQLNPLVSVIFSLMFAVFLFLFIKIKNTYSILLIIGIGMLIAAIGYYIPYYALENISGKLPYSYAVFPMIIISIAEVFISPFVILAFYHFSPARLKGLFLGVFMLITAIGNSLLYFYGNNYEIYGAANSFKKITIHILFCAAAIFIVWFLIKNIHNKKQTVYKK